MNETTSVAGDQYIDPTVRIGPNSVIGYDTGRGLSSVRIGERTQIGCFCVLENGCELGVDVRVDHYCRVGAGSVVGDRTLLLYGAQIFEDALVGSRCIIGGPVDDRTIIEDDVTYMGTMAHSYRRAGTVEDWDAVVQPSIIIRSRAVVGQGAVLVGGIEIGSGAYIGAGEVVRTDVPAEHAVLRGAVRPLSDFRGLLGSRDEPVSDSGRSS
jgi:acetyltransferase-like isoleucine patch superfamily enzyme